MDQLLLPLRYKRCTIIFPTLENNNNQNNNKNQLNPQIPLPGLLVQLTRLNIPCNSGSAISFNYNESKKFCGKLEEYSLDERTFYFKIHTNTTIQLYDSPFFRFTYKLVDHCYNVTLSDKNNTIFLQSQQINLNCNFKIHLPYGNRISFSLVTNNLKTNDTTLHIGGAMTDLKNKNRIVMEQERIELSNNNYNKDDNFIQCKGGELHLEIIDRTFNSWKTCINIKQPPKLYLLMSSDNVLAIHVSKIASDSIAQFQHQQQQNDDQNQANTHYPSLFIEYNAISIDTITSPQCAFGWISVNQFCVTAIEQVNTWKQANDECGRLGGKLAAIRNEEDQHVIDQLILNR